jgi:hypothetical protein
MYNKVLLTRSADMMFDVPRLTTLRIKNDHDLSYAQNYYSFILNEYLLLLLY